MKRKILTAVIGLAAIVFIYFLQTGSSSSYDPSYVPEDFKYEVSAEEAAAAVTPPATPTPTPTPTPEPTREATPEPTPEATPEATPEPTPEPTPESVDSWTLSFVGGVTIGTVREWQGAAGNHNMLHVIGENYEYPFKNVAEIFKADNFTMGNFRSVFTDSNDAKPKLFNLKAAPRYAETLSVGGFDIVSLANDYTLDYKEGGYKDTIEALNGQNMGYTDAKTPYIAELGDGLKLGVISYSTVDNTNVKGNVGKYMDAIKPLYQDCVDEGCDFIVLYIHWDWDGEEVPNWAKEFAAKLAETGFDAVIGSRKHTLQKMEYIDGMPVFYSLGNFCYGANTNPDDKDSAIVQLLLSRNADDELSFDVKVIPCALSSQETTNDFCPIIYEEGSAAYNRVIEKLSFVPYEPVEEETEVAEVEETETEETEESEETPEAEDAVGE